MQLKTRQIVGTLNLDCFHCVGLYSDCKHVIWIAILALTDRPPFLPSPVYKLFGEVMSLYAASKGELHADD